MPVPLPPRPTGLTPEAAEARERAQQEMICMQYEERLNKVLNWIMSQSQGVLGQQGLPDEQAIMSEYASVRLSVEADPDLLRRCPRLKWFLDEIAKQEEARLKSRMLKEWEQSYGTPQIPTPPSGGGNR